MAAGFGKGARLGISEIRGAGADLGKLWEGRPDVTYPNPLLNAYIHGVFRFIGGQDKPFTETAVARSLIEQVRLNARQEGLRGAELQNRITDAVRVIRGETPSRPIPGLDDMVAQAIYDGNVATFRNETFLGRKGSELVRGNPLEFVMPFTRTPAAVAQSVLHYSPLGLGKGVLDAARVGYRAVFGQEIPKALQRQAAEGIGRGAVGATLFWFGYHLAGQGHATGPLNPGAQLNAARQMGAQPSAVQLGIQWLQLGRLSPAGNLMAAGAALRAFLERSPNTDLAQKAVQTGLTVGRTVLDQPFVMGVKNIAEAAQDIGQQDAPDIIGSGRTALGRFAQNTAASFVPAGVSALARAIDPTVRRPRTYGEALKSRVPFLSEQVPPLVNPLGKPVTRPGNLGERLFHAMFDPTNASPDLRGDPVIRELADAGYTVPAERQASGESSASWARRQAVIGEALYRGLSDVIRSSDYQAVAQNEAAARKQATQIITTRPDYAGYTVNELAGLLLARDGLPTRAEYLRVMLSQARRTLHQQYQGVTP